MTVDSKKIKRDKKMLDKNGHLTEVEKIRGPLPKLEVADIVLIRIKKNIKRQFLRAVTNSYWDHAAMVIFAKDQEKGYPENLLIESAPGGVKIHKMKKYMNNAKKYDVGIKRVSWLSDDLKNRTRALMLLNVGAPYYQYSLLKLLLAIVSETLSRIVLGRQRYSCSGFVQKNFYEAVDWDDRYKVIYSKDYVSPLQFQNAVTPGEIAQSDKCEWIYNKHK
jgi:hypothetical protein